MSTPEKDLIAVPHLALITNESALKQLTTIFNRIALPGLSVALRPDAARFFTPELNNDRQRLVDLGILYEPDVKSAPAPDSDTRNSILSLMADANEILKPFGTSVEEMLAARNNPEELKRIRERTSLPNDELAARIPDHQKLMQTEKRISVNTTRMSAIQVRQAENSNVYATIPSGDSSLDEDDQRPNKHDVLKIAVVVPVPEDQAPLQHIIDLRNDPDSQGGFFELKEWMSDIARGVISGAEAQQKLESLLDQYRRVMQRHEIRINWTKLEAFVVTSADDTRFQQGQSASPLFAIKHRKLALLEAESSLPGSVVAFVLQAKSMFEMEQA